MKNLYRVGLVALTIVTVGWLSSAAVIATSDQATTESEPSSTPTPNFASIPFAPKVSPGQTIFKDSFSSFDASWGSPGPNASVTENYFILVPIRGETVMVPNTKYRYRDFDASVDVTPTPGLHGVESAGLVFWGQDGKDYYVAAISNTGKLSVIEIKNGRPAVKAEKQAATPDRFAMQTVTISVATHGDQADVSGWGATLSFTNAGAPKAGFVGLCAESSKNVGWIWRFGKFAVKAPSK